MQTQQSNPSGEHGGGMWSGLTCVSHLLAREDHT